MSVSDDKELPALRTVKAPRHPGVSNAVCEALSEAAEVCLARHHTPPRTSFQVEFSGEELVRYLAWSVPNETAQLSWRNQDDATRDGAYIISLAIVEHELGMVALSRADTRTGADYYIGRPSANDLEGAFRLEVSGVGNGGQVKIRRRLRQKLDQASRGDSFLPAYASVVGFREATILVSLVEDSKGG
jgi:hypothetical protein